MSRSSWKRLGIAVGCGLVGLALDIWRQGSMAPLLFGRMVTLPVAILFGPWYGALAALIHGLTARGTFAPGMRIVPLEAIVIGFFCRRGRSPLLGGFLVWTAIAGTLIAVPSYYGIGYLRNTILPVALQLMVSGMVGIVVADLLANLAVAQNLIEPDRRPARRLRGEAFHAFVLAATVPVLVLASVDGQLSSAKDYSAAQSNTPVVTDAGNPNLKPVSADQGDISLEYNPSRKVSLTAAAFYKHLTNFVTTAAVPFNLVPTNQPAGAPTSFNFTELTYVNGDSANVYGVELGGQYFFDNGFGVQANATYNHSRANRAGRPTTDLEDAVPFSANAKVFYEKHGIDASISYQFQSRFVSSQYSYIDYLAIKQDPYHELAASIAYDLTSHVTAYVQGSNLLGSATQRYSTYPNVPAFYEYTGRSLFFGLRARL